MWPFASCVGGQYVPGGGAVSWVVRTAPVVMRLFNSCFCFLRCGPHSNVPNRPVLEAFPSSAPARPISTGKQHNGFPASVKRARNRKSTRPGVRPHTHTRALRHIKAQMHTQHRPAKCTTTEAQVQSVVFCTAHCPTVVKHMGVDNSCTVKLWFAVIWQRPLQDRRNIRLHRP